MFGKHYHNVARVIGQNKLPAVTDLGLSQKLYTINDQIPNTNIGITTLPVDDAFVANTKDITLIIPLKVDSKDRLRNINTALAFSLKFYGFKIIIKEVDSTRKYNSPLLNDPRVTYIFEQSDSKSFHRTKILNDMLLMVDTEFVANYDCDIILPIQTVREVLYLFQQGYDMVYPYRRLTLLPCVPNNSARLDTIVRSLDSDYLESVSRGILAAMKHRPVYSLDLFKKYGLDNVCTAGGVQFFRTKSYLEGYAENETFVDWGPEDQERLIRFHLLGYKIAWMPSGSISGGAIHMNHAPTVAHSTSNEMNKHNHKLLAHTSTQIKTKEDMEAYMKTLDYVKRLGV